MNKATATADASQRELQDLYDHAPCGYHSADESGVIVRVNNTWLGWLGYSREEIVGRVRRTDVMTADSAAQFQEQWLPLFKRKGWLTDVECEYVRKDQSTFFGSLSASAVHDARGHYVASREAVIDVTERRRAEANRAATVAMLRESEERLHAMFEQAAVGIVRAGVDGVIFEVNGKLCEMVGRTPGELVGTKILAISHPDHAGEGIAMRRRILEGSLSAASSEKRFVRADGSVFWAKRTMSAVRDASGHVQSIIHFIEDISESKKAAEEILALNASLGQRSRELEAANAELEAFSYSVSHDLRAPLRHINGYGEMLAQDGDSRLSDEGRRCLEVIRDASGEMAQLIDDLLAFSRMGRAELREGKVDMSALVEAVREGLEIVVRERNIHWTVGALPQVRGDRAMLRQVYANLIGNAVKYSRPRDPAEIEIGCSGERDSRSRLVFFVKDNGVGFDMKYASKLFGVFQRLHGADEFEGTGVGLANVQRIIKRHGGDVWAESAPGKGAAFYFTLSASD